MTPEEMEARLLYRDGLMLVIDKPAGLPVHRGPVGAATKAAGKKGALEDHFDALRFGLPRAPALAHRLDRETSGCLVLGRHRKALATLGDLFKQGKVGKTYWALVEGGPEPDEGIIDLPLGRLNETRGWWMKVDPQGQPSVSTWKVMGRAAGRSWLALEPVTGRTHQLRVHCQAMGWPIVGDAIHDTDIMLWFTGDTVASAYAQTVSVRNLKFPDIGQTMSALNAANTATAQLAGRRF